MIDIHTHIIPLVDDGSKSLEESLMLLRDSVEQGITDIICTPHHNVSYSSNLEKLQKRFEELKQKVSEVGIPIKLYLGQEIFVDDDIKEKLKNKKVLTLNNSKYVLLEFDCSTQCDIEEVVYELRTLGYIPIIAHVERYPYVDLQTVFDIRKIGGLIQVNADSIVGKNKRYFGRRVKKMLNNGSVDIISSDIHMGRANTMLKAKEYIQKKYGDEAVNILFYWNANKIIKSQA